MTTTSLINRKCSVCNINSMAIREDAIDDWMLELPDWQLTQSQSIQQIKRLYSFPNFKKALAFAHEIGKLAEEHDHHPAILIEWGKCQINWWTHMVNGLHENDFILAAKSDVIYTNETDSRT